MADLDRAIESARAAVADVKALAARSAPACWKCRWFHNDDILMSQDSDFHCRNPVVATVSYDPADGEVDYQVVTIAWARGRHGLCKPEGVFFERGYFWPAVIYTPIAMLAAGAALVAWAVFG